jgi:hypothetical protein
VATAGYVGLAAVLRHKLKFDPRRVRLADVVVLLTFVPAGTTLTALSYCGVLYLGGALPADQFYAAMRYFWTGDTVGIITTIPAATTVFAFLSKARWRWSGDAMVSCFVFLLGTCLGVSWYSLASGHQRVPFVRSAVSASGGSRKSQKGPDSWLRCQSTDLIKMPRERCVHIIDDEENVRDALAMLLSTAKIKSRAYASAEEYLACLPVSSSTTNSPA